MSRSATAGYSKLPRGREPAHLTSRLPWVRCCAVLTVDKQAAAGRSAGDDGGEGEPAAPHLPGGYVLHGAHTRRHSAPLLVRHPAAPYLT